MLIGKVIHNCFFSTFRTNYSILFFIDQFNLVMIFLILQVLLIIYLGTITFYIFTISVASLFKQKLKPIILKKNRKFAVLIPGFKEDQVILEVAKDAISQDYPNNLFDIIIIADSFLPDTIAQLKRLPITVFEVSFENSTKSKSINKALSLLPDDYDIALILDADNLMAKNFLSKINDSFSRGFLCVQAHRTAKNTETSIAILDAISEEINNKLFRKGHRVLGLSSALIGSGMAFDFRNYKNIMQNIHAVGGFDKELELILIKSGIKIEYCEDAILFDEKVSESVNFSNQRRRWLSAQYVYFKLSIGSAFYELVQHGNFDYFVKSIQFSFLPRILLVGFLSIMLIFSFFMDFSIFKIIWIVLFFMCFLALLIAVPKHFYNTATFKALIKIPQSFFIMFITLFKLHKANEKFIHTQHGSAKKQQ